MRTSMSLAPPVSFTRNRILLIGDRQDFILVMQDILPREEGIRHADALDLSDHDVAV